MFYVIRILNKVVLPTGDPLDLVLHRTHQDTEQNVILHGDCLLENGFQKKATEVFAQGMAKFQQSVALRQRYENLSKQPATQPMR
jgi:hypothetical protein